MFLFEEYHKKSKNRIVNKVSPGNPEYWPKEWKTTTYKKYDGCTTFKLPDPKRIEEPFCDVLKRRVSLPPQKMCACFDEEKIATLLYYSCGEFFDFRKNKVRRFHPSGGARYPLEHYLLLFKDIASFKSGIYHYSVQNHELALIKEKIFSLQDFENISIYEFVKDATCLVVTTAIFERSYSKYKERAYRYMLLEAGAVMQNICLCASACDMNVLPLAGVLEDVVESMIEVDGDKESVVSTVLLS